MQSDGGSPHCCQTYTLPSDPIQSILVLFDHNTLFQFSTVQFSWYLANFSHLWQCASLSMGTFFLVKEWNPASFNAFLTFCGLTECESGIDEIYSLNSNVKPPRVDLSNNGLLVMGRELGGLATRIVLFVESTSFPNLLIVLRLILVLLWIWQ